MAAISEPRRHFFRRVAGALAAAGAAAALVRFLLPRRRVQQRTLSVEVAAVPLDGALVYRESRVALVRDADGFVALSLVCTHLGCTLSVTPQELVCPCHGSRFDRTGAVLTGPATRPLQRLPLHLDGDRVEVELAHATEGRG